jgi:GNAT superfamily N-acetyltransferase
MAVLAGEAFPEGGFPGEFSAAHYCSWWAAAFDSLAAAVFLLEIDFVEGMLCATATREIMTGQQILTVVHWYVRPKYRGHGAELLNALFTEAARRDVKLISAGCMMNQPGRSVAQIYLKKGFRMTELTFLKQTGAL